MNYPYGFCPYGVGIFVNHNDPMKMIGHDDGGINGYLREPFRE